MNIQTKASFKKELLAYFRTRAFISVFFVIIGCAVLTPLLISGMGLFIDSMSDFYNEIGTDVSGFTDALNESTSTGIQSALETVSSIGLIVILITFNSIAGGEQKKRSVIIPANAGLRSFSYIFPKFIIYPLSVLTFAVIAAFTSWFVSVPLFAVNDLSVGKVFLAGLLSGFGLMIYVCFHLALGTATGKPRMSAAVCIIVSFILPSILLEMGSGYIYNPFTLDYLIGPVLNMRSLSASVINDIFITIAFALGIMIITFLIALFVQNAKKIDNSGNEIEL